MIRNETILKLSDIGKTKYFKWPYKDQIFVYYEKFYGGQGVCVYLMGEKPAMWAILYNNEVEEIVDFGKIIPYEELM